MKFRIRKWIAVLAAVGLLSVSFLPQQAAAEGQYKGYIYDNNLDTPISINGYLYQDSLDGIFLTSGAFKSPEDLFVSEDDLLYLVDGGNNRVLKMDKGGTILQTIGDKSGKGALKGPKGVYVDKTGEIYVADTQNRRIAIFSKEGKFDKELPVPKSEILGKDFVYSPSKLIVDKRGFLYVVSDGASQGMLQIRPDGSFAGFFGANHVDFDWTRVFVKLLATKEQRDQLASVRPPEFSNIFEDQDGFIYTTTLGIRRNQIKRLSPVGIDTLNTNGAKNRYGDYFMPRRNFEPTYEAFVDVAVDKDGVITALDQTTGKLFQYDKLGNLMFIFGGLGAQDGLFKTPSSVGILSDGTVYVVDKTRGRIDRFRTTPFADKVHEASRLYVEGKYEEAEKPWHEALRMNSNYDLAYLAIGKSLYKQQKYHEAMNYFQIARTRGFYSDAYLEYRKIYLREHFGEIIGGILAFIVILRLGLHWLRKRRRKAAVPAAWAIGEEEAS